MLYLAVGEDDYVGAANPKDVLMVSAFSTVMRCNKHIDPSQFIHEVLSCQEFVPASTLQVARYDELVDPHSKKVTKLTLFVSGNWVP